MSKFDSKYVSAFSIEGRFLGFELEDGYKRKYLRLGTTEGEVSIKLAKHLRVAFDLRLTPGDWLQILGERKLNHKTGKLKLKAERILTPVANTQQKSSVSASPQAVKPKASILVCQKSDCMKKGGKQVCQAIQATLCDRGLDHQVEVKGTGCLKQCKAGPNIVVMPDKTRYSRIQADQIPQVIDKHFTPQAEPAISNADIFVTVK